MSGPPSIEEQALDIVAFGEAMVEFNQTGQQDGRHYLQGFGGDSSNFAIAAARQGARVAYLSALGDDPYGHLLRAQWEREGVDHHAVMTDPDAFTAIYVVTHDERGHHPVQALGRHPGDHEQGDHERGHEEDQRDPATAESEMTEARDQRAERGQRRANRAPQLVGATAGDPQGLA